MCNPACWVSPRFKVSEANARYHAATECRVPAPALQDVSRGRFLPRGLVSHVCGAASGKPPRRAGAAFVRGDRLRLCHF